MRGVSDRIRKTGHKAVLWLKVTVLIVSGAAPVFMSSPVSAAQLSSRKVTISTSKISTGNVQHKFDFNITTGGIVQGLIYSFCTTPVGTCTKPAGMTVNTADHVSQTGWSDATAFTAHTVTNENDCSMSTNDYMMCFERSSSTPEAADAVEHIINDITSPSTYMTVYIRISTYSDNDFQTVDLVDQGTVAAAYVRQLTVTGRVAERLEFCVAALTDGDGPYANCAAFPTTTSIAIGTIDDTAVYTTPVPTTATNLADNRFGAMMVNTNASGGVVLQYFPEPATSVTSSDTDQLRSFRVIPTDCSSTVTSVTDQCFKSAGATKVDFSTLVGVAGQERFGMQVPCVVANDSPRSTTANITVPDDYDNADNTVTTSADCENTTTGDTGKEFAFVDSGTPTTIASSSSVVDDEMVKIRFGATASATTPEGSYLVVMTYVATPTF